MRMLRDLGVKLVSDADIGSLYQDILKIAMALSRADAGTVQLLDEATNALVIVATEGFSAAVTAHFAHVDASSHTSCGIALARNERSFVEFDAPGWESDEALRLHVESGYRTGQSTPLVSQAGKAIGMVSTHWRESRHRPTGHELDGLDLLASQVANLIELRRSEQRLRESRAQLEAELKDARTLQQLSAELRNGASLHEALLDAAIAIMGSNFASLQRLDPADGALELLAARGFSDRARTAWKRVAIGSCTSCGIALSTGKRVVLMDVRSPDVIPDPGERANFAETGIVAVQTTPLLTRTGRVVGMISTQWRFPHAPSERALRSFDQLARQAADMIDRATADAELAYGAEQLREADRRKDEFLAVLAHELRNPLAPIRTGLELLRVAGDSEQSVRQVREMMERQVGHMVRLVDDLLDVSRITSGKIRLQREIVSLSGLVETAIEANREALSNGALALDVTLPRSAIRLEVDPTRFVQIVSNVLHNAIKFTPPGGRLTIEAHRRNGHAVLTVTDSGAGISKGMLPHVFDLFVQGDHEGARGQSGLGIGLALARKLAEMHGGTIAATSEGVGKGSTFTIEVPVAKESGPTGPRPRSERVRQTTRRVLVIDDNRDAAESIATLVLAMGGEAVAAFDGESGVAEAMRAQPHLVFVDIGMPGMDGYDTARALRRLFGDDIMLVALTGWGQDEDKRRSRDAGFDHHLTKPPEPDVLERLIASCIARDRGPR